MGRYKFDAFVTSRQQQTFSRLRRLVANGYVLDLRGEDNDPIQFRMDNRPSLFLDAEGNISADYNGSFDYGNNVSLTTIYNGSKTDDLVFDNFINSIGSPVLEEVNTTGYGMFLAIAAICGLLIWKILF